MGTAVRFIDPCAPRAYATFADLTGLGGTEAILLRVTRALAAERHVTVEQSARDTVETHDGLRFLPMDLKRRSPPHEMIVVINSWKVAMICRKRNPDARICVWQHVFPGKHNRVMAKRLAEADIAILCVSQTHAKIVDTFLGGQVRVSAIVNPIDDDLRPLANAAPRDPDLLFFASSPHKGLDQVAAAFATLRERIPTLRLELADPGYLVWDNGAMPAGVVALGTLSHAEVIAKMRSALCLFYPQTRFAETFGLVIAEANAVGCPALVHRGLGANDEVTADPRQCIDAQNPDEIAARILGWRKTPPVVSLSPYFRMAEVMKAWRRLLASDVARSHKGADHPVPIQSKAYAAAGMSQ